MRSSLQDVCTSARHFLGRTILKRPGSTCNFHKGYCDSFGYCVTVDGDDVLRKLRDAFKRLFSKETVNNLWEWVKAEWYVFIFVWWLKLCQRGSFPWLRGGFHKKSTFIKQPVWLSQFRSLFMLHKIETTAKKNASINREHCYRMCLFPIGLRF